MGRINVMKSNIFYPISKQGGLYFSSVCMYISLACPRD